MKKQPKQPWMGELTEKPDDIGMESKSPAERDRIDLNHEISGAETGRLPRFLSAFTGVAQLTQEEKKSERRYQSMLHMLLMEDAAYARLYYAVEDKLTKAYQAVDLALIDIEQRLLASEQRLDILRDQATRLDDGTIVFLSSDNSIYTADGQLISDAKAKHITISKTAPSRETYTLELEKRDALLRDKQDITEYKSDVLDDINQRFRNEDDTLSKDELQDLEGSFPQLPELKSKSIHTPAEFNPESSSVAHLIETDSDKTSGNLRPSFKNAHEGLLSVEELEAVKPQETPAPSV